MKSFADRVKEYVQAADGNRSRLASACGTDVRTIDRWSFALDAPSRHDQVTTALAFMEAS